ncbi:MAG: AmmeMemoRadiSam system protein B, partial [Anaerolineae bacterium]|nr:AmmeMemoRadiSam system protein B [Anaerolineae bacterium]
MSGARFSRWLARLVAALVVAGCGPAQGTPTPLPQPAASPTAAAQAARKPAGPVRPPAVAGQFYPDDPEALQQVVHAFLEQARGAVPEAPAPLALLVPHAGYPYSGAVAARAYALTLGHTYEAIVILGANHTLPDLGMGALYPSGAFATPLGEVPVARDLAEALASAVPDLATDPALHRREHSIEVQLPFLQVALPGMPLVPLIVGDVTWPQAQELGRALARALDGRRVLLVATSDLSHYPTYEEACQVDGRTVEAITTLDGAKVSETDAAQMEKGSPGLACTLCGRGAILTALAAAQALGAEEAHLLLYANSGDALFGAQDQVVGYAAFGIWPAGQAPAGWTPPPLPCRLAEQPVARDLNPAERERLLEVARETLAWYLTTGLPPLEVADSAALYQARGAFVTLKKKGELRGCIGNLAGQGPLIRTVQRMAIAAATEDRRFPPVTADELPGLQIEISVLSPLQEVPGPEAIRL